MRSRTRQEAEQRGVCLIVHARACVYVRVCVYDTRNLTRSDRYSNVLTLHLDEIQYRAPINTGSPTGVHHGKHGRRGGDSGAAS